VIVTDIKVEADPSELGFDAERLARLDSFLHRFIDSGALPGYQLVVARRGQVVHASTGGQRDLRRGLRVEPDTLFRIYSMTKPITSVAAMMLYEQGEFELSDPVAKFIPAFADMRVYAGGGDQAPLTVPATEPIRMVHLLTHTSGLTYGFFRQHPVDALYRAAGFDRPAQGIKDLADVCERIAGLPLLFQPGSEWAYSMATDVVGRVVEVISGQSLAEYFAQRIFAPLGMTDTAFGVQGLDESRVMTLYASTPQGCLPLDEIAEGTDHPQYYSGGGGLISSAADYNRFTSMLLGGGELGGVRLLSNRTLAFMASNHLPGGADMASYGRSVYSESGFRGNGFGLGFSVVLDPVTNGQPDSPGAFGWGGAASTVFWVDPVEQLTAAFYTQVMPSSSVPVRGALRQLVYQALVDVPPQAAARHAR
jgi:CubicO group peptidase (beta-lactamase class C family)